MDSKKFLRVGSSDLVSEVRQSLRDGRFRGAAVKLGSKDVMLTLAELDLLYDDLNEPALKLDELLDRYSLRKTARNLWKIESISAPDRFDLVTAITGAPKSGESPTKIRRRRNFVPGGKSKVELSRWNGATLGVPSGPRTEATSSVGRMTEASGATTTAWLGAEFENHDARTALKKNENYVLAFMSRVGEHRDDAAELELDPAAFGCVLTIQLVSSSFRVVPPSQLLHVDKDGISSGRARFEVVPLKDGLGTLDAIVVKDGNFVHRFTLQARIGIAGDAPVLSIVGSAGRGQITQEKLQRRDLLLMFDEEPGGFSLTAVKAVAVRGRLKMTAAQLASRVAEARAALLAIVNKVSGNGKPYLEDVEIAPAIHAASIRKLAEEGYLLYQSIFFGPQADKQLNLMGDRLRDLAGTTDLDLQIVSDRFLVPWPLLYVAEHFDPNDIRPERFLGFSNRIEQIPLQNGWNVLDCEIRHAQDLAIGINVNNGIDAQMGRPLVKDQLTFFDAVEKSGRAKVTVRDSDATVKAALTTGKTSDQLMYCFCHAESPPAAGSADDAQLQFEGGKAVTLRDLRLAIAVDAPLYESAPLVFINACESAQLSPLFYDGFVPFLLSRGARGVIGTECDTPAIFAKEFATRFFHRFLNGEELGRVVLELRQEFLRDHNNVMGLLYGVYCNGDTRVDPSLGIV